MKEIFMHVILPILELIGVLYLYYGLRHYYKKYNDLKAETERTDNCESCKVHECEEISESELNEIIEYNKGYTDGQASVGESTEETFFELYRISTSLVKRIDTAIRVVNITDVLKKDLTDLIMLSARLNESINFSKMPLKVRLKRYSIPEALRFFSTIVDNFLANYKSDDQNRSFYLIDTDFMLDEKCTELNDIWSAYLTIMKK